MNFMPFPFKCDDCGRKIEMSQSKYEEHEEWDCKSCGGSLITDDELEEEDTYYCDNCGNENVQSKDIISFDCGDICKECIDKEYPRESKIEYREKIVEKPIIKYVNQQGQEIKPKPKKVFSQVF